MLKKILKKGYVSLEVVILAGVVLAATGVSVPYIMNQYADSGKDMAGLKNKIPDASVDNETGYIISGGESIHINGITPVPEVPNTPIIKPDDGTIHVESITVNPTTLSMKLGETKNISWTIAPSNATNKEVIIRLSNRETVSVSASGTITAIGVGAVDITIVSVDTGVSSTVHVIVTEVPSEDIILNYDKLLMVEGTKVKLDAQVVPANTTNATVTFSSENLSVATVDQNGNVTAGTAIPGANTTNIIVTNGSIKKIIPVEVIANRVYTTGIEVDSEILNMYVGDVKKVIAKLVPADASNKTLTYKISDTSIATVDANGNVTAKKAGSTALYIYNYGGDFYGKEVRAAVYVNVIDKTVEMTSLSISYPKNQMTIGETQSPTVSIFPDNATERDLIWSSNNTAAVTVDKNGNISAEGTGSAVITAKSASNPSVSATFTITVVKPAVKVSSLIADKTSVAIKVGEVVNIGVDVLPENADNKQLLWTSADDSIAVADTNNSQIVGISAGTTNVKISSVDNPDVYVIIQVVVQDTPINSIAIEPESIEMDINSTQQFVVSFEPASASNKSLKWSVSDTEIGTISETGLFTSKAYGKVTVTATAINGMTANATIVVKEITPESIEFDQTYYSIVKGTCVPFDVTVLPKNVLNKNFEITVDNTAIASVDVKEKEICGLVVGETSMTAKAEKDSNVKAVAYIDVTPVLIEDLFLNPTEVTLNADVHQQYNIPLTVYPADAMATGIAYSTTNPQVATVDEGGLITAVAPGECNIEIIITSEHAMNEDALPKIFKVKVVTEVLAPTDFIIDDENILLTLGENNGHQIRYHFVPSNATQNTVQWESTDESVAIVDSKGIVYPVGVGRADIIGTNPDTGLSDYVGVQVKSVEIASFRVEPSELLLSLTNNVGGYVIEILPANAEQSYNISYDSEYVEIDRANRTIVAKKAGNTTVYFYDYEYNKYDSIEVEIMSDVWSGDSDGSDLEIKNGVCKVRTPEQLSYLSLQTKNNPLSHTCESVELMNSLDMSGGNFTPFNTVDVPVYGNGYAIKNLYIANTGNSEVAFIKDLTGGIYNLTITNANIEGDRVSILAYNFSGIASNIYITNNNTYSNSTSSSLFYNATKGVVEGVSITGNNAYSLSSTSTKLSSSNENIINSFGVASLNMIYVEQDNAGSFIGTSTSSTGSLNHIAFNNNVANAKILNKTGKVVVKNSYFLNTTDYSSMSNPMNVHFGKDNSSGTTYSSTTKYDASGNVTTSNTPAYTLHANTEMKNSQSFVDLINSKDEDEVWFMQKNKYPNFLMFATELVKVKVLNPEVKMLKGEEDVYVPQYIATPSSYSGHLKYTCEANTNDEIATVSENCEIKALKKGNTEFVLNIGGFFETIKVTIDEKIYPTGFSIVEENIADRVGFSIPLTYTLTPSDANTGIVWSSSDELIASIDAEGTVYGVSAGTVTIKGETIGQDGTVYSDTVSITVLPAADPNQTLMAGSDFQNKLSSIKDTVTSIEFVNVLPQSSFFDSYEIGVNAWDVSEAQDGAIMAYLDGTKLIIAGNESVVANKNSVSLFSGFTNVTSINAKYLNTNQVELASNMFSNCTNLKSIEHNNWSLGGLTDATQMFANCSSLTTLKTSSFTLLSLTNATSMFQGCSSIPNLDLTKWDTTKLTNATDMFKGMVKLEQISFGEKFKGSGKVVLPTPSSTYIPNANGYWYLTDGSKIAPNSIKNGAYTYYANPATSLIKFTATFNSNGGSTPSPSTITKNFGETLGTLPTTSRTGYTFNGWYTATSGGSKISTSTTMPASNTTYYAQWTPVSYTITYNLDGGTVATANKTSYTIETATFTLNNPTKEGHTFVGWTGSNGTTPQTSVSIAKGSTGNKTYTANWDVNEYTYNVVYTSNSGVQLGTSTYKAEFGTTNTIAPKAFTGYTSPATQTIKWDSTSAKTITFTYTPISYSISYTLNGGTVSGNPTSYTVETASFTLKNPTKTGNGFTGWTGTGLSSASTIVTISKGSTGDRSYTANWQTHSYVATFNPNGGNTPSFTTLSKKYGEQYGTLPTVTRTGYTFNGWYTATSGGTKISTNTTMPDGDITYYAQWTANSYVVAFNGNGATSGSMSNQSFKYDTAQNLTANAFSRSHVVTYNYNGNGSSNTTATATSTFASWNTASNGSGTSYANKASVKNLTSTSGGTVTLYAQWTLGSVTLPTPTRTGYTFKGWYDASSGGNKIGAGGAAYKPTANKTLYAQWTANTYSVKFNGNGSTGGSMSNQSFTYGVAQTLTANAFSRSYTVTYNYNGNGSSNTTATANYCFTGWNTVAGGTGTAYANKASVSNLTTTAGGTVNLYAQWTSASVTLPTPTRTGYTFKGWYDASSGGNKIGAGGASYTPTANKTLYAQWTINQYTATFNANGGTTASPSTIKKDYNAELGTLPTTSRTGYTFNGWYTATSGGTKISTTTKLTANVTYYAQWTVNSYNLTVNPNGGTWNSSTSSQTFTQNYGTTKTIANPTRTGYTFNGWSLTGSGSMNGTTYTYGAGAGTLTANWKINTYNLTINPNGGKWYNSTSSQTITQNYGTHNVIVEPTRAGYVFTGWSASATPTWNHKFGAPLYTDTSFTNGMNNMGTYNNNGNGATSLSLISDSTNPYGTKSVQIKTNGSATPGAGGFVQPSGVPKTNNTYYHVIVANVPTGYTLNPAYNSICGGTYEWITSNAGTGTWTTYVLKINTGSTAYSSSYAFGYIYLNGSNNTSVTWKVGFSTIYDASQTSNTGQYTFTASNITLTANWRAYITQYRCRYWGSWSGWQNSAVSSSSTREVQTQWIDTSYWGSWSGWQNSAVSSSSTRQVETKWVDTSYWSGWSGWQNSYVGSSSTREVQTQWIDTSYWGSWSGWTTTAYSSSSTRNVETRTAYTAWSDSSYRDNGTTIIRRELWHDCYNNTDICSIDTNLYSFWTYQGNMKLVKNGVTTTGNERYFVWNTTADANDSYWLFGKTGSGTTVNGGSGTLMATGTWSLGDMAYSMSFVRYGSSNVYTAAWGRYLKRSAYTEYRYRDYISQGYTQYRYRDYISQGYTQYRYRDYVSQGYTQYKYRDMGSWSDWTTSDCSSGYAGRETRYGDYNK